MAKVVVAMSGGVDSTIAAAILKERGYEVIGVAMEIWDGQTIPKKGIRHACYGPEEKEDIEDARKVAQILKIPFFTFDLRKEYKAEVLNYFCQEYLAGRTPNPCIRCNRKVKFEALLEKIWENGIEFDYFATGHYARIEYEEVEGRYLLKRAKDLKKDQSYFLFSLSQAQLSRLLFPLGDYTKEEVRRIAKELGLEVYNKPESQNFFAGDYSLLSGTRPSPGPILSTEGEVLGEHRGIPFYTIGQRKGIGIAAGKPLYVLDILPERNAIVVGGKEELYGTELIASELNWIAREKLDKPIEVKAKIRYQHKEAEALVMPWEDERALVKFREPQMAITPGQAVVFYDSEIIVGGGIIERRKG